MTNIPSGVAHCRNLHLRCTVYIYEENNLSEIYHEESKLWAHYELINITLMNCMDVKQIVDKVIVFQALNVASESGKIIYCLFVISLTFMLI